MSLKDNLDEFLAKEGWYEVEGADGDGRVRAATASMQPSGRPAPSCSHRIWDRVDICRGCGISREVEDDVDA